MMKRIIFLPLLLLLNTFIFAQSIEITPIYTYTISGDVDGYHAKFDVKDNPSFGGILSVEIDYLSYFEFSYIRNETDLSIQTRGDLDIQTAGIGIEHYQVGVLRELKEDKVRPYAKLTLGASRYFEKSGDENYWLFSAGVGLGAKMFFNDKFGIRLYTNLMLPMEFDGGGIFCGIGSGGTGCSGGVSFNVPLVHWDLGAGLIIKLPNQ